MKQVDIVGAGISGLVAGIMLARQGNSVRVYEAHDSIGGTASWSDSTLLDPSALRRDIGVDVEEAVEPWKVTRAWAYGRRFEFGVPRGRQQFTVERGAGPSSIDNVLYRQALEAGVEFELGRRLSKDDILSLAPGSIVATGLDRDSFELFDIPSRPFFCHMTTGPARPDAPSVIIYLDRFTREFGYYCQVRGVASSLVFSVHRPLTDREKGDFKSGLALNDGIDLDGWSDEIAATLAWPLGAWRNRRLLAGEKILAGTLAGNVSPVLLFGVSGALASGRVAALAVADRDDAVKEFRRLAPLYAPQMLLRKVREYAPHQWLKYVVWTILGTYDPDRFPYLMEFVLWPPGL